MNPQLAAGDAGGVPRPRRWRKWLIATTALFLAALLAAWYLLQPARLTALILAQAGKTLGIELHTTGPGSYALRPEPRLVLPGLSALAPGEKTPFFRSARVEFALPWATLRGKSAEIGSIVLDAPDVDADGLRGWLATLPPRTTPLKLPTLARGLQIVDGRVRGTNWRIDGFNLSLPTLADGKPSALKASGAWVRGSATSRFDLQLDSTLAGMGKGLRIDAAQLALRGDGDLPSLTAAGNLRAADDFSLDLRGALQRIPSRWAAAIDSVYSRSADTPFSIAVNYSHADADPALPLISPRRQLRLQIAIGDPQRQPALTLDGQATVGDFIKADLHGQLSRWPDAWLALPAALATGAAALAFDASYRGTALFEAPIEFALKRADADLQGSAHVVDLRGWLRDGRPGLPPVEATLSLPRVEADGVQLRGVRLKIGDDTPAAKPATAPKS